MTPISRRLYRSRTERKIAGLCAGLGDYFDVDPVVVRLTWILVTCFTGIIPGVLAYVVAWLVVPDEPVASQAAPVHDPPQASRA